MTIHTPLEEFYITMPELPSHTEVMATVEPPAPLLSSKPDEPEWAYQMIFLGAFFIAISGAFLMVLGLSS